MNHSGYCEFRLNKTTLSQLPEDGDVLEQLTVHTVGGWTEFLQIPALQWRRVWYFKTQSLQGRLDNETGNIVDRPPLHRHHPEEAHQLPMSSIRHTPLSEFNQTQPLLYLAYPTIFPRGLADFVTPRQRGNSYQDYLEHAIKWNGSRFAHSATPSILSCDNRHSAAGFTPINNTVPR